MEEKNNDNDCNLQHYPSKLSTQGYLTQLNNLQKNSQQTYMHMCKTNFLAVRSFRKYTSHCREITL